MAPELITLQLGSYANYAGAHFWNLQDEAIAKGQQDGWSSVAASVDHEVLCSWSEDQQGSTSYAPRTVVVDFSGALGGVSFSQDAAEAAAAGLAAGTWSGAVQLHSTGKAAKSKFRQQLEAAAEADEGDEAAAAAQQAALEAAALLLHEEQQPNYWTDYLQVDLHPSTMLTVPGVWQGTAAWQGWGPGPDSSSSRDTAEAASDRVRWWAEQCDRLQGLQVLGDDLGGWGGLGRSIVQELREDYPSQPLLYFSLQQQQQQQQQQQAAASSTSSSNSRRQLSQCVSVAELTQLASLYVPLQVPASAAGGSSTFQTAALLATAIDTATLPLRCSGAHTAAGSALGSADLHSLCHLLSGPAANLAALALQLPPGQLPSPSTDPAQLRSSSSRTGSLLSLNGSSSSSSSYLLTPGVQLAPEHCLAESLTLRGARAASGSLASSSQAKEALDVLLLQRQRDGTGHPCVSHACISPMPLALPLSFPHWLGSSQGAIRGSSSATGGAGVANLLLSRPGVAAIAAPGALSRLTATASFEGVLAGLSGSMRRIVPSGLGRACLEEWGYSAGDANELQEQLMQLAGRYSSEEEL